MLNEMPSELREKLQTFKSDNIVQLPTAVERLPYSLLSDDLFVKMMILSANETRLVSNMESGILTALLSYIADFKPDGIVMHRETVILYSLYHVNSCMYDITDGKMQCVLFGIRTIVYKDCNDFPWNKVLMIRQEEGNPLSMLLRLNDF